MRLKQAVRGAQTLGAHRELFNPMPEAFKQFVTEPAFAHGPLLFTLVGAWPRSMRLYYVTTFIRRAGRARRFPRAIGRSFAAFEKA